MTNSLRIRLLTAVTLTLTATTVLAATILHDLTGKWAFTVVTANGTGTPTVTLRQEGEKLTGTYESNALGSRSLSGSVKGDSLHFTLSANPGSEGVVLTYVAAIVTADSLNGRVDFSGQGGADFTAVRRK